MPAKSAEIAVRQLGDYRIIREIGRGAYSLAFAHSVRVDAQDNIWTVDEGSNMVMKFNPQGLVTMVLGRKDEAVDMFAE